MMKTSKNKDRIRLSPEGELTVNRAADFRLAMLDSLGQSDIVEIDLAKIEAIDLSCLQILCAAHRTAVRDGKTLSITGPQNSLLADVRKKSGFTFHKSCQFNPADDCLWIGGLEE